MSLPATETISRCQYFEQLEKLSQDKKKKIFAKTKKGKQSDYEEYD